MRKLDAVLNLNIRAKDKSRIRAVIIAYPGLNLSLVARRALARGLTSIEADIEAGRPWTPPRRPRQSTRMEV